MRKIEMKIAYGWNMQIKSLSARDFVEKSPSELRFVEKSPPPPSAAHG
jgi:hypothetical protein